MPMRILPVTTLCTALLISMALPLHAQDSAPRPLAPRVLAPAPKATDTDVPNVTPIPVKTLSGGINVQSLSAVSSESLGVLSGSNSFGAQMWQGSTRPFIEALLAKLPAKPHAPYLRILQRRLLLSAAQPPQGASGDKTLLALRAEKLVEMGQTEDVIELIDAAPQEERTPDLAKVQTQAYLMAQQNTKACAQAAVNSQTSTDPFWVKTLAFCRLLAKQNDQAMLSLSLLRDSGDNDPVYYQLMDAINNGERAKIDTLPAPSALELALITANKAILSDEVRASESPNMLSLLTKNGDVAATQKAVELNIASVDFMAQAFKAMEFSTQERTDALAAAEKMEPLKAQALLYQVSTKKDQLDVVRSETMALAFELAAAQDRFFAISRLYAPLIAQLPHTIDMLWFAPTSFRALLAAGDWENAKSWYLMLRNAAFTDAEAAQQWTLIRPLAALAGFDVAAPAVAQALTGWWLAQEQKPESFARAARLFSMMEGLGLVVPDALWLELINGPAQSEETPKAGLWIKLGKAVSEQRLGETVLLSLLGFNGQNPQKLAAPFLHDSLAALKSLGLERDARAVAVETALSDGY